MHDRRHGRGARRGGRRSAAAGRLAEGVRRGRGGVHPEDVELCLEADGDPFAMAAARPGGHLVPRPVS
ncbi:MULTISPECIES: hypothetical protein [Streptomyces]|uniref:hypothetical protein n=1 Tax=Streptomyces TaxID=1883 RepID=UPI00086AFED8|nr:hypothetical protein [Streptomyces sp. F-1]SFY48613.1 hypothetical protein STEPF1_01838 [Streptomyces sp. F-1]